MPGVVVLNPATVDGYGNPISVTRDYDRDVNRLLTSGVVENFPTKIIATDGYDNPISVTRDEATGANRLLARTLVENFPTEITATDGYGNPISVTRDEATGTNRLLASTEVTDPTGVNVVINRQDILEDTSPGITAIGVGTGSYIPCPCEHHPHPERDEAESLTIDAQANLRTRSLVLTDEGTFRDDFSGDLITQISGQCSFTNGSDRVIGTGTAFLTEINLDCHLGPDGDLSVFVRVKEIISNTELILEEIFDGITGTYDGYISYWLYEINGTGASVDIDANQNLALVTGTGAGNYATAFRAFDYLPIEISAHIQLSQRIDNQKSSFGFSDTLGMPNGQALVVFEDANSRRVKFVTARTADKLQTTEVALSGEETTGDGYHEYTVSVSHDTAKLRIDGILVAEHRRFIPDPYVLLYGGAQVLNTASVPSSLELLITNIYTHSFNRLETASDQGEPNRIEKAWPIKVTDGLATATILEEDDGYEAPAVSRLAVNIGSPSVAIRGTPTFVVGQNIPDQFEDYVQRYVSYNDGYSLNVNGSVTPVIFTFAADAERDIQINELRVGLTCADIVMDGGSFCSSPSLTNGVLIEIISGGSMYTIFNIKQNEDWLFFNSPAGMTLNNTGPKDLMSAGFYFGEAITLYHGTADTVRVTIRDNLTGNQMPSFFRMKVFGFYK